MAMFLKYSFSSYFCDWIILPALQIVRYWCNGQYTKDNTWTYVQLLTMYHIWLVLVCNTQVLLLKINPTVDKM